jgi:hypothetical protein
MWVGTQTERGREMNFIELTHKASGLKHVLPIRDIECILPAINGCAILCFDETEPTIYDECQQDVISLIEQAGGKVARKEEKADKPKTLTGDELPYMQPINKPEFKVGDKVRDKDIDALDDPIGVIESIELLDGEPTYKLRDKRGDIWRSHEASLELLPAKPQTAKYGVQLKTPTGEAQICYLSSNPDLIRQYVGKRDRLVRVTIEEAE